MEIDSVNVDDACVLERRVFKFESFRTRRTVSVARIASGICDDTALSDRVIKGIVDVPMEPEIRPLD
jgi:hypothetical protein